MSQFNCSASPDACKAPFNCHLGPKDENGTAATNDGHADWRTWCTAPQYLPAAMACQQGDLRQYGHLMHTVQYMTHHAIEFIDAHYCFKHGHCDDEEITANTTLDNMEAMCDQRFGTGWRTMALKMNNTAFDGRMSIFGPYLSSKAEENFARMACAMGNYHCDAIYCKQEFCKKAKWRLRWGAARPAEMVAKHGKHYPVNF